MKKITLLFYLIGIFILILLIKNLAISILNNKGKGSIITSLKNELEVKKKENTYLKEKLNYVKTADFIEEEARNKLGLVQKNEYVVIAPNQKENSTGQNKDIAIWKKWLNLFL